MEVVLSPGRFGDEAAGAPFQNEEIREWSHVDRLTGMLERARVETGRWQTSNQGAARSYGKVIDSRERNSADGSVVQRARRQVEVFQSQGPGRSVQVVRASQWSSSRVTDSTITVPQAIVQKEAKPENKFSSLCGVNSPASSLCRDESISERLSSLLGSFTYPASSTVPLRRIDSKYASRTPISLTTSKRCSSNENVSIHDDAYSNFLTTTTSLRETKKPNESCQDETILEKQNFSSTNNTEELKNVRVHDIIIEREGSQNFLPPKEEIKDSEKKSIVSSFEEIRQTAAKAAIHLLPSSKANTTVVNLMNSENSPSWLASSSTEKRIVESNIGESSRSSDSSMPSGRVKRVGFCKTEIHFAADSGKVNIVETDGKPPPTNKFRRRRRNSICNKNSIIANLRETNYNEEQLKNVATVEDSTLDDKTKNDPNLHRGHTTTVNLGNDFAVKNERNERGFPDGQQQLQRCVDNPVISNPGMLNGLENRIYDRLESYSSQLPRDSSSSTINIQQSSLKSARLVLNITRNPGVSFVPRILPDIKKKSSTFLPQKDEDSTMKRDEDNSEDDKYLDWVADNEVKCIMLGTSSLDNQESKDEFFHNLSKENENNEENRDSPRIDTEETSRIVDQYEKESMVSSTLPSGNQTIAEKENYNVLCTDAENNQVLLKVVTTHEPTIARVENDHNRKKTIPSNNLPIATKKGCSKTTKNIKTKNHGKEHTYVNVFTGSKRAPIYENYKIPEINPKSNIKVSPLKKDDTRSASEKIYIETKTPSAKSNDQENSKVEKVKTVEITDKSHEENIDNIKKSRNKTKEIKQSVKNRSTRGEVLSINSTTSGQPRVRSSSNNVSKGLISSRTSGNKSNTSKSTRDVVASVKAIKKNEGTTRQKPEVIYQTAVYNMKNERLSRPQKGKESKGPRYLNELICGAKTKRASESKNKTSSTTQNAADKGALQRHWK